MTSRQTCVIGETAYSVGRSEDARKISVCYKDTSANAPKDIELMFYNGGIIINENAKTGNLSSTVSKLGDAVIYSTRGELELGATREKSPIDVAASFKNLEQFKQQEPRVFGAIHRALAAINLLEDRLELSLAQQEMIRQTRAQYGEKELAH